MPQPSDAVRSILEDETEYRSSDRSDRLDRELEATFPASDPLSVTRTGAPVSAREEKLAAEEDRDRPSQRISELHSSQRDLARPDTGRYVSDIENRIRERPLAAVMLAATLGFVYGTMR